MGLLFSVLFQAALYLALYWIFRTYWPVADDASYLGGVLHTVGVLSVALLVPRAYFYFRRRGWTASPRMWWNRIEAHTSTDYRREPRGWDFDVLRVEVMRNRERGSMMIWLALVGLHLHMQIVLDPAEAGAFLEGRRQAREAYLASVPPQVRDSLRDMMRNVPLEAQIEVGAIPIPVQLDREDDDDDDGGKSGGGGGSSGVH